MELHRLTILQAHEGLIKKEFSACELTKVFLNKIAAHDKEICSFITVTEDLALSQAKRVDEKIQAGNDIPVLAGIPLAVKDAIMVEGIAATCASQILKNYIASYTATCILKLELQGAVILGKTNMDEFGMGSSTENSAFFSTKNPLDKTRVPGGSSGGSAAATKADLCSYALGADTGGSIRLPASFCGVVGLRPTYGAVSRYGLIAFASSLDQIGPLAKTAEDAEIVFDAIAGKDDKDATSLEMSRAQQESFSIADITIGVPKEYFAKGIDPEVERLVRSAIQKFEQEGAHIEEVSLPHTQYALAAYYLIVDSEASANLARYDGIKYGLSSGDTDLLGVYLQSREEGFGDEVKRRIMLGTYALSAGYYDAYYVQAQKVRTLLREDFEKVFQKVDVLFTPTSPVPAFKLKERIEDPLAMYLADVFTVAVSLAGLPVVSVPVGAVGKLPVGMQIIGKPFAEHQILALAHRLETV